jgi:hypothetical protein
MPRVRKRERGRVDVAKNHVSRTQKIRALYIYFPKFVAKMYAGEASKAESL